MKRPLWIVLGVVLVAGAAFAAMRALAPVPEVPAFTMAVTGGAGEPRNLAPRDPLSIVLRPQHDVAIPLDVRGAIVRGSRASAWSPPARVAKTGVVTIEGPASSVVPGVTGPCELIVAVGPRGHVPDDPDALAAARPGPHLALARVRVDLLDH